MRALLFLVRTDRSHALRGNASRDAPRSSLTSYVASTGLFAGQGPKSPQTITRSAGFVVSADWRSLALLPASSRASPLPQGFLSYTGFVFAAVNVGARLARDGAGTGNKKPADDHSFCGLCCFCGLEISSAAAGLFAGKPAPTGISVVYRFCIRSGQCGSEACPRWGRSRQQKARRRSLVLRALLFLRIGDL